MAGTGDEVVVEVVAAGLHPRVRSQASGSHYTRPASCRSCRASTASAADADGPLVYFVLPDTAFGAMAERTVIDLRRSVPLPADADPVLVAAAMNPAMSSWIALRARIAFEPGQNRADPGGDGQPADMAVQVAKRLGAAARSSPRAAMARLCGAAAHWARRRPSQLGGSPRRRRRGSVGDRGRGRRRARLPLGRARRRRARAIVPARADGAARCTWMQIGAVAGADRHDAVGRAAAASGCSSSAAVRGRCRTRHRRPAAALAAEIAARHVRRRRAGHAARRRRGHVAHARASRERLVLTP